MAKKNKIDSKKLVTAFKDQKPLKDIVEEFGFKTSTQAKNAYLYALMETGIAPKINTSREKRVSQLKETSVNKRGSIIIPKVLVASLGFKEGDTFMARKSQTGISLKLMKEEG